MLCLNNPVNRVDINGNSSIPNWAKIAIGTVATAAAVAVTFITGGLVAVPLLIAGGCIALGTAVGAIKHRINTGSWQGCGSEALQGAIDGLLVGGIAALATSVVCGAIKTTQLAKTGLTIGKKPVIKRAFEDGIVNTARYNGMGDRTFKVLEKLVGKAKATNIGWTQNKIVVKTAMKLNVPIYNVGGELTGAYAKEKVLTYGYRFLRDISSKIPKQ